MFNALHILFNTLHILYQLQLHAKFLRKHLSKHKNSVDHFMTVAMTRLKDLGVGDKEWSEGHELGKVGRFSFSDVE